MMDKPESSDKRIAVTASLMKRLREFSRGLDANYSDAIDFLLDYCMNEGEDPMIAGRRLRDKKNEASKEPETA